MDKEGGAGGDKKKQAAGENDGEKKKPSGDKAPPPPGVDPDYVNFTSSLQSASAKSSSTAPPESRGGSRTAMQTGLADVLNEHLLDPLYDKYRQGTEMVQTNVVDPFNYVYSQMTADNAAGIVQTHVVDPVNQAYQDMSAKATELVQTHVVGPVNQAYEDAPAYFQNTIKDAYNRAADMYDVNVAKPAAKAAGSFTDFLKNYGLWQTDNEVSADGHKGGAQKGEDKGDKKGEQKSDQKGEHKGEQKSDQKGGQKGESKGVDHKGGEVKGEDHKGGDHKGGDSKPPKTEEPRSPPKSPDAVKGPDHQKSATELPLKPALKRRDSLTVAHKRAADHGGDGTAAPRSPDRLVEGKGGGESGHKVKFGYEEVRTLPPEKKHNKHDFNEFVEDQLGKLTTKPTSQKESKELIDAMMKEAAEAKAKEEKKRESTAPEGPDLTKTAGKATGKSVAGWVASPEEKHEYRKFQDMLHSKDASGHKKGDESGAKDDKTPAHDKPEAHKPPPGGSAKHHEEGHKPEAAKPGDKQGGKEETHKKAAESSKKPEPDKAHEKEHKPPGDKAGSKPDDKPSGKPQAAAAAPTAGLTAARAGQADHGPTSGGGPAHQGAAAPVRKSSSWWKTLRHFFRRKPADEESSEEEGVHYREMDEEFIECAEDLGAAGEVAHGSGKGGDAGETADASAAAAPKQYKLNACLLVTSGAVIFVVLLAVLLAGDLFDDLDNSVPTFDIDTGKVVNFLDEVGFLGAGMNSSIMGKPGSWRPLLERPANDSLVLLLRGLAPAVLRFAGHETDHFYFVEGEEDGNSSRGVTDEGGLASRGSLPFVVQRSRLRTTSTNSRERFPLMGSEWIALNHFVERCNWRLLFSLNAHRLEDVEPSSPVFGRWDLRDAALLMRFSERHNLTSKLMWQLGEAVAENWPGPGPSPYALACEYEALRDLVSFYPAPLVGPGVSTLRSPGLRYLERFIKGRGRFVDVVSLRHVLHDASNVTVRDLLDPAVMERFDSQLQSVQALVETVAPRITRIWLTSLSTTPGFVDGVSGTFASMLAWTEAFGTASKRGVAAVLRDSLLGTTAESMIVATNEAGEGAKPSADYWVTLLLAKHVGQKVLTIEGPKLKDPATRVYVHCARNYPGGLALYGVRLADTGVKLKKAGSRKLWERQLRWILTPASDVGGTEVYLNGETLSWSGGDGTNPPDPMPEELWYTIISLPAWSVGLFVFPNVKAKACYDDWTP